MKKFAMLASLSAFALLGACGEDTAVEETGGALEEQADAVEDYTEERASTIEEFADQAENEPTEDLLSEHAEQIEERGEERAGQLNEMADRLD